MAIAAYPLPEFTPDLAKAGILTRAVNVRVIANGYAPVEAPQAVTAALPGTFNGGGSFIDSADGSTLLVATPADVYKYDGAAWNAIGYGASARFVRFAQFGDNVLIANGGPVKSYALITGTLTTPTAAPNLIDVAQARDFVMGITADNALQWSQFNNSGDWTLGANQADKQPSLWGSLRRIIGGEYVIALTDRAVIRGTYVGTGGGLNIIWQFDEISAEIGCMSPGSVANVGRLIFFLSERGFEICDGHTVTTVGDEKFNRWFFDTYSRADIAMIAAAVDPRRSLVLWAMPGTPGRILAYNWVLQKATTYELDVHGMMTGYSVASTLETLGVTYPGGIDTIPVSLDDPSLQGGNPILLIADSANRLNALTGDNLGAAFTLDNLEPAQGIRARVRKIRLVTDALDIDVALSARMRMGDPEEVRRTATTRSNGQLPIRANGRFNTLNIDIPPQPWSFIQGCELEFEAGDAR